MGGPDVHAAAARSPGFFGGLVDRAGRGDLALARAPWARCDWGMLIDAAALRYPEARDYLRPAWDLGRRQG